MEKNTFYLLKLEPFIADKDLSLWELYAEAVLNLNNSKNKLVLIKNAAEFTKKFKNVPKNSTLILPKQFIYQYFLPSVYSSCNPKPEPHPISQFIKASINYSKYKILSLETVLLEQCYSLKIARTGDTKPYPFGIDFETKTAEPQMNVCLYRTTVMLSNLGITGGADESDVGVSGLNLNGSSMPGQVKRRKAITKFINSMGGHVMQEWLPEEEDASSPPSMLIVDEVGSKKYQQALKLKIPIYHSNAIFELARVSSESRFEDAFFISENEKIIDKFRVKPLTGLHISCSGFSTVERNDIYKTVEALGGTVCKNLKYNTTSHLICKKDQILDQITDPRSKAASALKWGCDVTIRGWLEQVQSVKCYVDVNSWNVKNGLDLECAARRENCSKNNATRGISEIVKIPEKKLKIDPIVPPLEEDSRNDETGETSQGTIGSGTQMVVNSTFLNKNGGKNKNPELNINLSKITQDDAENMFLNDKENRIPTEPSEKTCIFERSNDNNTITDKTLTVPITQNAVEKISTAYNLGIPIELQLARLLENGVENDELLDGWRVYLTNSIEPKLKNDLVQLIEEQQGNVILDEIDVAEMRNPNVLTIFSGLEGISEFFESLKFNRKIHHHPFEINTVKWLLSCSKKGELPKRLVSKLPFSGLNFDRDSAYLEPITRHGGELSETGVRYSISEDLIIEKDKFFNNPEIVYRPKRWLSYQVKSGQLIHSGLVCRELFLIPTLVKNLESSKNIFENFKFTSTGWEQKEDENFIKELVNFGNGEFSSNLKSSTTTHLIVSEKMLKTPEKSKKMIAARKYGIKIVSLNWAFACLYDGKVLEVDDGKIGIFNDEIDGFFCTQESGNGDEKVSDENDDAFTQISIFESQSGGNVGVSGLKRQNTTETEGFGPLVNNQFDCF